jgi:type II secretory pathway pseudopilin PulG
MTRTNNEAGFSYIDLMIAMVIMMVGILALTGALTVNLLRSYETDSQLLSKQYALSTIESIFSTREIHASDGGVDGWNSIGNVGNNPGSDNQPKGIFLNGFNPIRAEEGFDGVAGTADDACATGTACASSGHPSNNSAELKGFLRKIEITDVAGQPGKRRIDVTIRYSVNRTFREEKMSTLIAQFQ